MSIFNYNKRVFIIITFLVRFIGFSYATDTPEVCSRGYPTSEENNILQYINQFQYIRNCVIVDSEDSMSSKSVQKMKNFSQELIARYNKIDKEKVKNDFFIAINNVSKQLSIENKSKNTKN